jgi:hypothetical protein
MEGSHFINHHPLILWSKQDKNELRTKLKDLVWNYKHGMIVYATWVPEKNML